FMAAVAQPAQQLGRLVGRNAAGYAQHDALCGLRCGHRKSPTQTRCSILPEALAPSAGRRRLPGPRYSPSRPVGIFEDNIGMSIKHWPAQERPREKLSRNGAQSLSDAELLAIFLGSGVLGEDAVIRARRLLA